jgi:hypothetical protein
MEINSFIVIAIVVLVGLWIFGLIRKVTSCLLHGLLLAALLLLAYALYTGRITALP